MQINKIIKDILKKRGFRTETEMEEYFSHKPKLTYDPYLIKGMREAVELIIEYANSGKRICIFGDYDADGVTSVVVMRTILLQLTDNLTYYIPSRFDEGYGLNMKAIENMARDDIDLIITVDCGCTAVEEVARIKELGMEIIVTDHHSMTDKTADCLILNPKQKDDEYPYSFLCGCGVAFKLTQAIVRRLGMGKDLLNEVLDVVAIATVGDIVPLRDENRTLVKYGMAAIKRQRRIGLKALMDIGKINPEGINAHNIAFGIVPRINSAGRLRSANLSVELLSSTDKDEAAQLAVELNNLNEERRNLQNKIFNSAVETIETKPERDKFIVYYAGSVNEGVTGIVAGNLRERYDRPVIVLTDMEDKNFLKGTGRSVDNLHLYDTLKKYEDCFLKFGGHSGACGFTMYRDRMEYFIDSINGDMEHLLRLNPSLFEFEIAADASISAVDVSIELAEQISEMEPFGQDNEKPIFEVDDIQVNRVLSMGKENQYRKYFCSDITGGSFDAVLFDVDLAAGTQICEDDNIKVLAEIGVNIWNNKKTVQLNIKKIIEVK